MTPFPRRVTLSPNAPVSRNALVILTLNGVKGKDLRLLFANPSRTWVPHPSHSFIVRRVGNHPLIPLANARRPAPAVANVN